MKQKAPNSDGAGMLPCLLRAASGGSQPVFMAMSDRIFTSGLTYCFYMWCIFDNPDPIFTLQLVPLRKSCTYYYCL
ncbi:MAG: hypothetical protein O4805_15780 [Trichodesmium sp. St16_bin2-tuft]|nr:hypothetical protein [Trichodesmium sp. St18_bin1]MDE5088508.1 hypothetical protein [Trichodesmium sp. St16_bin2-tuft]MDE5119696.1 hypothetical protein [Trichodesmium sp. St19_bin1]